ncbi:MAG: aminoglycoside 6-adenylyltransferase [Eubacteriales bacterium]|nr:aminoglycoside 6-adenylyltransferase [Eubacteriales bacterium]
MDFYQRFLEDLAAWCAASPRVQVMALFGSRARRERPADEYSDCDVLLVVDDPDFFLTDDAWLNQFGRVSLSFIEPTAANGMERRVFYDDAHDADFMLYPTSRLEEIAADPLLQSFFDRGWQLPVDKAGFLQTLQRCAHLPETPKPFDAATFANLTHTFLFHVLWATKKALRGEIWAAKTCVDGYMKDLLRQMMECRRLANDGEVWHAGRFLDAWLGKADHDRLAHAFARYEKADILRAIRETMDLFCDTARETADLLGYAYPYDAEAYTLSQLERLSAPGDKPWLLVQVDGTLCDDRHRLNLLGQEAFYDPAQLLTDAAVPGAAAFLRDAAQHYRILYLAFRPTQTAETTRRWLAETDFPEGTLVLGSSAEQRLSELRTALGGQTPAAGIGDRWDDNRLHWELGCPSILVREYDGDWEFARSCLQPSQL